MAAQNHHKISDSILKNNEMAQTAINKVDKSGVHENVL